MTEEKLQCARPSVRMEYLNTIRDMECLRIVNEQEHKPTLERCASAAQESAPAAKKQRCHRKWLHNLLHDTGLWGVVAGGLTVAAAWKLTTGSFAAAIALLILAWLAFVGLEVTRK